MEPLDEEPRRRIPPGCSAGRIINMIVGFDYLLILVTSVVVVGILGGLDLMLTKDNDPTACPLYMTEKCTTDDDGVRTCSVQYGASGFCYYVEVSYGFLALWALVFFVIQIIRAVCKFDLWFTSIADMVLSLIAGLVCFAAAVTNSVGIAVTCSTVSTTLNSGNGCDVKIPDVDNGDLYYATINAAQGAAWMCLLFIFITFVSSILRVVIFFRRRKAGIPMDMDTSVLTATDDLDDKPE